MPDDKPDYRVYRSRPGFLSRLFNRRDASRFGPPGSDRVRELSGDRPAPGTAAPEAPPAAPTYPTLPPTVPEEPWWRRITWKKVVAGVVGFVVFWLALSLVLFMISANQQSDKVSKGKEQLEKGLDSLDGKQDDFGGNKRP